LPVTRGLGERRFFATRQAVPGFDLEAIRLRPGGFVIPLWVESHHGASQFSALESEAYVVKILSSTKPGKFSKHSKHGYGLCSSPAADQIGDLVALKSFIVVYVATYDYDPGLQRVRVLGQIGRNFLLVFRPWKDRVTNGRIVQHDKDEFRLGACVGNLPLKPSPLFASRLQGLI
jgi:hypothetical protein